GGTSSGTDVPAPPMTILFGAAAAAILGRRKFKIRKGA
ncbi:MAG: PEP-CTERM sorting domain-containing protein, partial [Alphaproteobacteria bacterium]